MKITLIGAGNVGYHLGKRLFKKGIIIQQVYSRNLENATTLAKKIKAIPTNDLASITNQAEVYIIAVKDDAIAAVAKKISQNKGMKNKLVVHTSVAASSQLIGNSFKHFGVFYPLQTFSKNRQIKFSNIPICINADGKKDLLLLKKLGKKLSKKAAVINDEERAILHVAAVIVNNFSNHLFHIGQQITAAESIGFDLLMPLIQETVLKIEEQSPLDMQTGPARRNDQKTIKKHLQYLQKFPEYAQLYALLTKSIQHAYRR